MFLLSHGSVGGTVRFVQHGKRIFDLFMSMSFLWTRLREKQSGDLCAHLVSVARGGTECTYMTSRK